MAHSDVVVSVSVLDMPYVQRLVAAALDLAAALEEGDFGEDVYGVTSIDPDVLREKVAALRAVIAERQEPAG